MNTTITMGTQEIGNVDFRSLLINSSDQLNVRELILTPPPNALSVGNSELLEVILNAGAVVAGVEGVFRCIRTYLKSRRQESIYLKYESLELNIDTNNLKEAESLIMELVEKVNSDE